MTKGINNQWYKTGIFLALASASVALLLLTRPSDRTGAALSDQGTALTPALTDPQKVASLEVIGWDEQRARTRAFKVALEGNRWVIPSAYNYPVDATQNMAAAASAFVGLIKERVVTDLASEHARLGVLSPDDLSSTATAGRGTRITMRDTTGATVADLIIGISVVEGDGPAAGAPSGKRYVRIAGENRVYSVRLNQSYSTKLADWVQSDLLSVATEQVKRISIERYRIDEQTGSLQDLQSLTLTRAAQSASAPGAPLPPAGWIMESSQGPPSLDEPLNQAKVDETLNALSSLRIVGVRPKPANLASLMAGASADITLSPADQLSLQRHGFFITANGLLVANEGGMNIQCGDGVIYTLWFGQLATDEATREQAAGSASEPVDGRYMMVTVSFDEAAIGQAPTVPAELLELEAKAAAATPESPMPEDLQARLTNLRAAQKVASDGHATKVREGRERQARLARRFAGWYYVVDVASLAKVRPTRADLTHASAPQPMPDVIQTTPPPVKVEEPPSPGM